METTMSESDWIVLRVLIAAMRSDVGGKLTANWDIVRTVKYLQKKYDYVTLWDNVATIHKEYGE